MIHHLKILPQYYCRVADGSKTFEVRKNDRGFQPGDLVTLKEFNPENVYHSQGPMDDSDDGFSGEKLSFKIGYVLPIDAERVVFSLLPLDSI